MPFSKGNSGNPTGRPIGTENRVTAKARQMFADLLDDNLDRIRFDLAELEPKDRVNCLIKMAQFVVPKLQSIQIEQWPDWIDLAEMSADERKAEIARLKKAMNDGQED